MPSVNEIRSAFLDYFSRNGHERVASSSLVPHDDPSLLFTNAGMVQFKNLFTGVEHRPYSTAVTSQKCVRAGGKHNDLDNVGYTARHHTFFEMLGNFSFGDYFKERAIELAWNLITKEFGLPKDKLLATVYAEDEEAAALWRKIAGLSDDKIIRIATSDNFWAMGETGPCGPCSEIFYDHGDHVPGGPPGSPDEDGDRFIEIWNLVFMQYEQVDPATRVNLPRPSIDTGMGLERVAAVLQGVHDNYDIDLFRKLIAESERLTGTAAQGDRAPSHKVIADHLRAASFLIADGVTPSNEGRGYVLRRIMRRGMRHAHLLGADEPILWRMVPALVEEMGGAFPELGRAQASIEEWLKLEEGNFRRTLERGLLLLDQATAGLGQGQTLPGEVAFKLYDTYGFPLDLTQDALRGQGRAVDVEGFEASMARQKEEARKSWKGSGESGVAALWFELRERFGATQFVGYDADDAPGKALALVKGDAPVERLEAGERAVLLLDQTPFYAESGGQQGDTGRIVGEGFELRVLDTRKALGDLWLHQIEVLSGALAVDAAVRSQVDAKRRRALRRAHSATHLLHRALRDRLGDHVAQKGSLVAPDRLRFDFSQPKALSSEDVALVEAEVNARVLGATPVTTRVMAQDEAIEAGAMALFGEKYGDEVRVVSMGGADGQGKTYSLELCGGTHAGSTSEVGLFKIVAEGAVASGVRRVEALTGEAAYSRAAKQEAALHEVAHSLKVGPDDVPARVQALIEERRKLEAGLSDARRKLTTGEGAAASAVKEVDGVPFAGRTLDGVPAKELRGAADALLKQLGSGVVGLIGVNDGKAAVVVSVSEDLTGRFDAVSLVRLGVEAVGGKGGGGRRDFAQGGGPQADQAAAALAAIERGMVGASG